MTSAGVVPPEPRRVVLADEANARIREAELEVEELEERLRRVEAEIEAADQRGHEATDEPELPESAQLTVRFVDDLVSTNRERIRDLLSERYAWAGDRLVEAHVEAQEIVNDALAELSLALRERDAGRRDPRDEPLVAALLASIASPSPATDELVEVGQPDAAETGIGADAAVGSEAPEIHAAPDDDDEEDDEEEDDAEDHGEDEDDGELAVQGAHFVQPKPQAAVPPLEELGPAAAVDDVVSSAVQAVLRALTDPGSEAAEARTEPAPQLQWSELEGLPEPASGLQPPKALAGGVPSPRFEEFWGDQASSVEARPPRFRPRHVIIAMVLLVAAVIIALALIG